MSLLEDKYVTNNTIVDCEGGKKTFHGLTIRDSHLGTNEITVKDAFERSSNVAFAKLADQYYSSQPNKFIDHLRSYRLDKITGVDLTASSGKPTIKSPKNRSWSKTTIPYMAHGYEELVTPLHMLMLYNAVANNGKMMKPYLVSSIRQYGVEEKAIEPEVLVEKICSDETLVQLKECLLAVVQGEHGTARKIKDSAYLIAGKTGTAVTALDNRGYNKGNKIYQASFIGYFPANQPKYTVAVVIQNSKESKKIYGADVSGTVFKEISDRIYGSYLGTKKYITVNRPDTNQYDYFGMKNELGSIFTSLNLPYTDAGMSGSWRSMQMKNNAGILYTSAVSTSTSGSVTPNVVGMGLKDAVYLLENMGLKVTATGRGRVMNQSLAAGTNFSKQQNIALILN
jgi:cell division protein FtsI (penicillin-binding protein 3)